MAEIFAVLKVGIRMVRFMILSARVGVKAPDQIAAGTNDTPTNSNNGIERNHGKDQENLGVAAACTKCKVWSENVREEIDFVNENRITVPASYQNGANPYEVCQHSHRA
jgi:hypothetical protein